MHIYDKWVKHIFIHIEYYVRASKTMKEVLYMSAWSYFQETVSENTLHGV